MLQAQAVADHLLRARGVGWSPVAPGPVTCPTASSPMGSVLWMVPGGCQGGVRVVSGGCKGGVEGVSGCCQGGASMLDGVGRVLGGPLVCWMALGRCCAGVVQVSGRR
jgi:hypothetical protein